MTKDNYVYILHSPVDQQLAQTLSERLNALGLKTSLNDATPRAPRDGSKCQAEDNIHSAFAIIIIVSVRALKKGYPEHEIELVKEEIESCDGSTRLISCIFGRGVFDKMLPFKSGEFFRMNPRKWTYFDVLAKTVLAFQYRHQDRLSSKLNSLPESILSNSSGTLFSPDECDLYINKLTRENYIFHGKDIDQNITKIEFHHFERRMAVFFGDGSILDLGVRIQWLILPFIASENQISLVQTKNGKAVSGRVVPVVHVGKDEEKYKHIHRMTEQGTSERVLKSIHLKKPRQALLSKIGKRFNKSE